MPREEKFSEEDRAEVILPDELMDFAYVDPPLSLIVEQAIELLIHRHHDHVGLVLAPTKFAAGKIKFFGPAGAPTGKV